tara:strand:+ start:2709 stop:3134 length:426 start_codon:yes stop_codon:yes gene_type:complete
MFYTNVITDPPENALINGATIENGRDHAKDKKDTLLNGGKHTTKRLEKDLPLQKDLHCQKDVNYRKNGAVMKENKKKRLSVVKWIFSFHIKLKMSLNGLVEILLRKEDEAHLHEEALLCTEETIKEDAVKMQHTVASDFFF